MNTYRKWVQKPYNVVPNFAERVRTRIGRKSRWGNEKIMNATTAAVINTLYSAGPDLALAPKDMVNDVTRRATAIDLRYLDIRYLDKRGQESCGHDEYDGIAYKMYDSLYIPEDMNDLCNRYRWERGKYTDGKWSHNKYNIVRYESETEAQEDKNQHVLNYVESLKESYMTDTDWSNKSMNETTTRDERLDWMLQNYSDGQWTSLLRYKMCDWISNYKGECAWKDDDTKHCSHHDGRRAETVLMYYKNADGAFVTGRTAMLGTSLRKDYTQYYLDEVEDEAKFIKSLVSDEIVISHIKKQIPKMKTESRDWLISNYTVSKYKLKDESEPDTYANRKYYEVKRGKRGHYQLTWWHSFKQEDEKKRKEAEIKRQYEEDQNRHGLEINGWKFNAAHGDSKWRPANPVIAYEVLGLRFLDQATAIRFATSLGGWRNMMIGPKMNKGGAVIDAQFKEVTVKVWLSAKSDPQLYTPSELMWHLYNNTSLPDDYSYSRLCTHMEEE